MQTFIFLSRQDIFFDVFRKNGSYFIRNHGEYINSMYPIMAWLNRQFITELRNGNLSNKHVKF